ncbi:hypothetical protein IGI04_020988 [Brassica rapa subsp. trilocularis]|uniref:Major facilitator superfamily (MFS) profile domain-containing protein n=1 Tax=Brassica rapa subsp. trilocularis TaxID=1813537 RepID=A0ABQ7MKA7_BRACM|nr:hypothetical protein IGI04_020988 [Brassica rapa subsp. trilocularis]
MEGENSIEKGLLLVNKEETSANTTPLLVFTTFIIVSASFTFGVALGYTAGTMSSIMEDLDLSIAQFSVFGSLLTFGGMIGAIFSAKSADAFGRKMTLWLAEGFCISGWFAIALAKNVIWLDLGRFFVGIGVGLISYVIPVYIAEITPKNVRGTFTFSNQLLQNCGLATVYYLGNFMAWRTIALIGIIPCLIQFFGLFLIPESPRWLAREGGDEECKVVLQKLRGKEANVMKETREIMICVDATANVSMGSLFKKKYTRQLTEYLITQAASIFELAGFPSRIGMTVLSLVVVPKAILGLILVERWGRRPLLMVSALGLCLSCIFLALSFGLKGVLGLSRYPFIIHSSFKGYFGLSCIFLVNRALIPIVGIVKSHVQLFIILLVRYCPLWALEVGPHGFAFSFHPKMPRSSDSISATHLSFLTHRISIHHSFIIQRVFRSFLQISRQPRSDTNCWDCQISCPTLYSLISTILSTLDLIGKPAWILLGVPGFVNFTPTMAFIGVLTFNMMFAAGLGALPWIIMSEIFPMDMKAVAGSLVAITNWFTGWIVSYCFNFMLIWSQSGTFSIFAMISGLTILFAWCLVPETRGLSLEEIQLPHANILS